MPRDPLVPEAVSTNWETVIDDAEAMASEYDEDWETLVVHPGDVTALFEEPFGLDVLAPGDEYERVERLAEACQFDQSHVYRRDTGGLVLYLTIFEATTAPAAVLVPAFVSKADLEQLAGPAREADEMQLHVRPLSDDARATFVANDPGLFFEDW